VSNDGDTRPYDPAGTRPKVDPASLRAPQPPADLPWAEREERADAQLEAAIDGLEETHAEEEVEFSSHVGRFQFVLGGLLAIGAIAIAAIVLVLVAGRHDDHASSVAWSTWKPAGDDPLQAIAAHVGPTYRTEDGKTLVGVSGAPLSVNNGELPAQIMAGGQILGGKTAMFTLCGGGDSCTIPGKKSTQRSELISRESLELALYALHYTDAEQVAVVLPPDLENKIRPIFVLQRSALAGALAQPLAATLPGPTPGLATIGKSANIDNVMGLTGNGLFAMQTNTASDLSVYFQLGSYDAARAAADAARAKKLAAAAKAKPGG
jgi:hypothetical protein